MIKNLVIVESPAKAKTIEKFLGKDYKVMSSYGHIRDLKKKDFAIDAQSGAFTPIYEVPTDKKTLVSELKKAAKEAETVWLASDEDREGEAISWHLSEVLGLDPLKTHRIVFHEITKNAILNAIANPRTIDLNLVDAQQARRVLDRIVGFELSPVLWRKIKPALSAGRVQSVALRLIVERENEINRFVPEEYYRVTASFTDGGTHTLATDLSHRLPDIGAARSLLEKCAGSTFTVTDRVTRPLKKAPAPPFTTSTLQQEAGRKLGFTVAQTMMVAQRLYEAGHITYMRTDSLNLSQLALDAISRQIKSQYGEEYLNLRHWHTSSKGAQEAHEAIRPTYIDRQEIEGTSQERRLYNLIWKRTVASQMADAKLEKTTLEITPSEAPGETFTASGETILFQGFLHLYLEGTDDDNAGDAATGTNILPPLKKGDTLSLVSLKATQRHTQQPPRYTEASLVKKMEELGIGRPSTYAPTISTIQQREYVTRGDRPGHERTYKTLTLDTSTGEIAEKTETETTGSEKGKIIPTDTGVVVNEFLTEYFPEILDYNFTARIEEKFDEIADGNLPWHEQIASFYTKFHPAVDAVNNMHLEHRVGERTLGTDPSTGETVSVKIGRFGPLVQIGEPDSDKKPRFASLLKGQSIQTITLDEALELFRFPRILGTFEDAEVSVAIGRFGPYVKHAGAFTSIPKDVEPTEITLEQAVDLIRNKRAEQAARIIKTFADDPSLQILNGRFGPYIAVGKKNYKIPKAVANPADLTLDDCRDIIEKENARPSTTARRRKKS